MNQLVELLFQATGNMPTYLDNVSRSMQGMVKSEQSVKTALKGLANDMINATSPTDALARGLTRLLGALQIGVSGFAIVAAFKVFKDVADTLASSIQSSSKAVDQFLETVQKTSSATGIENINALWSATDKTIQEIDKNLEKISTSTVANLVDKISGVSDILREQKRLTEEIAQSETINRLEEILAYKRKFAEATAEERKQMEINAQLEQQKLEIAGRLSGESKAQAEKLLEQIAATTQLQAQIDAQRQSEEKITQEKQKQTQSLMEQLAKSQQAVEILQTQIEGGAEAAAIKQQEIELANQINEINTQLASASEEHRKALIESVTKEKELRDSIAKGEEEASKAKAQTLKIEADRATISSRIEQIQRAINERIKEGERASGQLLNRLIQAYQTVGNFREANNIRNQLSRQDYGAARDLTRNINRSDIGNLVTQYGAGIRRSDQALIGSALGVGGDVSSMVGARNDLQKQLFDLNKTSFEKITKGVDSIVKSVDKVLGLPVLR